MIGFIEYLIESKPGTKEHMAGLITRYWKAKAQHDHMDSKARSVRVDKLKNVANVSKDRASKEFINHYGHLVEPKDRKGFDLGKYGSPDKHGGAQGLADKISGQVYGKSVKEETVDEANIFHKIGNALSSKKNPFSDKAKKIRRKKTLDKAEQDYAKSPEGKRFDANLDAAWKSPLVDMPKDQKPIKSKFNLAQRIPYSDDPLDHVKNEKRRAHLDKWETNMKKDN